MSSSSVRRSSEVCGAARQLFEILAWDAVLVSTAFQRRIATRERDVWMNGCKDEWMNGWIFSPFIIIIIAL